MTLSITDTLITSNTTKHLAALRDSGGWKVTWMPDRRLDRDQALAAMELAEIAARGRDSTQTSNYAYFTWQRVKELAEVLGVIPLKTVLYLEGLERSAEGPERSDPK